MLPIVTIIGLQTGLLLSGAVLTETVFAYPGHRHLARRGDRGAQLPRPPGRDPLHRDRLRAREPARRPLLRAPQPADQDQLMSIAELESREIQLEAGTGGLWKDAWHRLRRNPGALVGFALVGLFVLVAVFAPLIAPEDPRCAATSTGSADVLPRPVGRALVRRRPAGPRRALADPLRRPLLAADRRRLGRRRALDRAPPRARSPATSAGSSTA